VTGTNKSKNVNQIRVRGDYNSESLNTFLASGISYIQKNNYRHLVMCHKYNAKQSPLP